MTSSTVHPVPAPRDIRRVTVAGSDTGYWVFGPEGAPVTAIAVHGFRGDHHGLLPIVTRLPQLRVIVADLPGFGTSTPLPGRHDVAGYAHWLAEFRSATCGDNPVDLIGHSFGSVICSAAVADGLSAQRLTLINPIGAPALSGPRAVLSRLAVGYYRFGAALPEPAGTLLLASPLVVRLMSEITAKTTDRRLRRWIHDQHHRYFSSYADRRVVVEAFQASVSLDVGDFADRIAVPTLLIAGDRDDITPVAAQQRLRDRLPEARLRVLADVGHLIHYERAAAAAALITDFTRTGRAMDEG